MDINKRTKKKKLPELDIEGDNDVSDDQTVNKKTLKRKVNKFVKKSNSYKSRPKKYYYKFFFIALALLLMPVIIYIITIFMRSSPSYSDHTYSSDGGHEFAINNQLVGKAVDLTDQELKQAKTEHYKFQEVFSAMENTMRFLGKKCWWFGRYKHLGKSVKLMGVLINDGKDFLAIVNPTIVSNGTSKIGYSSTSPFCEGKGKIETIRNKYIWLKYKLYRDYVPIKVKRKLEHQHLKTTVVDGKIKQRHKTPLNSQHNQFYIPSNQNKFFNALTKVWDQTTTHTNSYIQIQSLFDDNIAGCILEMIDEFNGKTICNQGKNK